ncbi:MAG: pyridoxamine 5'-phosphate oxidase family protein [Henriciella sp.]
MSDNNDLNAIEAETWRTLEAACCGKRTSYTWFTLATVSEEGMPEQRTVVLRDVDRTAWTLTFFTDRRTPKVAEIMTQPNIASLFFDAKAMVQLRFSGKAEVLTEGDIWQRYWDTVSENGKAEYAALKVPGTVRPDELTYDTGLAKQNFAAVKIVCDRLDWLKLARSGHQRAVFEWTDNGITANATVP